MPVVNDEILQIPHADDMRKRLANKEYSAQRKYLISCAMNRVPLHLHEMPCPKIRKEMEEKGYKIRESYPDDKNEPNGTGYLCDFE